MTSLRPGPAGPAGPDTTQSAETTGPDTAQPTEATGSDATRPTGAAVPDARAPKVYRTELNPVDFLSRTAYMYPENVAIIDGERRYSYREFAERSWRLANVLTSAGLRKGDRIATLLLNSAPMLEAHFAVPAAGGVLVAINFRLSSAEVAYILQHSGARYLLLATELEPLDRATRTGGRDGDPLRGRQRRPSGSQRRRVRGPAGAGVPADAA